MSVFSLLAPKTPDPRPFLDVSLNDRHITALIDSGAELSVIDFRSFCKLSPRPKLSPCKVQLKTANNSPIQVVGEGIFAISLGKSLTMHRNLVVAKNLNSSLILGADTLNEESLLLDLRNRKLRKSNNYNSSLGTVHAKRDITILPQQERLVDLFASQPLTDDAIFTSSNAYIPDGLISSINCKFRVLAQNPMNIPFTIRKGATLGTLSQAESVSPIRSTDPTEVPKEKYEPQVNLSLPSQNVQVNHLPSEYKSHYIRLIDSFAGVFSLDPADIGHCTVLPQNILLKDPRKIISIPPYRISPNLQPIVHSYVDKLLATGVIQRSTSPFCSPLLLVKKANSGAQQSIHEKYRVVHDFRALNDNTVRDSYPLHNLYDLLDKVAQAKVWSVIDLSSGFWNQSLNPDSRPLTAFAVPGKGHYEYTRSAQGLCNSPATFQRLLDFVVRDIPDVYVYIDDLVISSKDHASHLKTLQLVFERFRKYNFRCRPHKMQLATGEINYLGYNLSQQHGIRPGQAKTEAIKNWNPPTTVTEVKQFLGLCSFFRRTLPNFATIASPLTKLTRKDSEWSQGSLPKIALEAFQNLQSKLITRPCLQAPKFGQPFILTVDASKVGFGATLSQQGVHGEHPVAYASRTLSDRETKNAPFHLEYMAMVWACRHFKPYLVGKQFTLRTDHKPLQVMNKTKGQAFDRFLLELSEFDFKVEYIPGNIMPSDGLSRLPAAAVSSMTYDLKSQINISWSQIKELQQQDKWVKALVVFLLYQSLPKDPELRSFVQANSKNLTIQDKVLCHSSSATNTAVAFAPMGLRSTLLRLAHDHPLAGHYSVSKTLATLSQYWYWPDIHSDVDIHCRSCYTCQKTNVKQSPPVPLGRLPPPSGFNDRVHIDLLGPLPLNLGNKYVMVMVDSYSKWINLAPLPDKKMETVAQSFMDSWVTMFGPCQTLVSDLGTEFHNSAFATLASGFQIHQNFSSTGHAMSNGQAETIVKEVLHYLRRFLENSNNWMESLPKIRFSHNTSIHSSSKQTPYFSVFHARPTVPYGHLSPPSKPNYSDSPVQEYLNHLHHLRNTVQNENQKAAEAAKKYYDKRAKDRSFEKGDKVFIHRGHTGTQFQKFQHKFKGPYIVLDVLSDQNLTIVPYEKQTGRIKPFTIHANNVKLAPALLQIYNTTEMPVNTATPNVPKILPPRVIDPPFADDDNTEIVLPDPHIFQAPATPPVLSPPLMPQPPLSVSDPPVMRSPLQQPASDPTPNPAQAPAPPSVRQTRSKTGTLPDDILHFYPPIRRTLRSNSPIDQPAPPVSLQPTPRHNRNTFTKFRKALTPKKK